VIVSTGCLHARSGTYFPRRLAAPPATRTAAHPRARPSDVDQSGAEQDDATTIDCGSICVIHNFLTCNTGRINSLQSAHTRELSAEDVHNGRSGFPSTASSSPIYLHRTVSSRSHRKWAFDGKKSELDDVACGHGVRLAEATRSAARTLGTSGALVHQCKRIQRCWSGSPYFLSST